MAEGFAFAAETAQEMAETGAQEIQEFDLQLRQRYYTAFTSLRSELESSYTYAKMTKTTIEKRYDFGKKVKNSILTLYDSIKGGGKVMPDPEEQINNTIQQQLLEEQKQRLINARNTLYAIENENKFKNLAARMMALVYGLRADLTGVEEHFSFVYQGDTGLAEAITVPVSEFLLNENIINNMDLAFGSISDWSGTEDRRLKFNSSVLSQLKGLSLGNTAQSYLYGNNVNNYQHLTLNKNFMQQYETIKNSYYLKKLNIWDSEDLAAQDAEKNGKNAFILRVDQNYWIVQKKIAYQSGFIVQGLFGYNVGDINATFKPDNNPWYQTPDTIGSDGKEYSVKSFIEGDPSLVSLNSLYKVSSQIIEILKPGGQYKRTQTVIKHLKSDIFKITQKIENQANKDLGKVLDALGF